MVHIPETKNGLNNML